MSKFQLRCGLVSDPGDFVRGATDPVRTGDELFTVELLIERMRAWLLWPFPERALDFEESLQRKKFPTRFLGLRRQQNYYAVYFTLSPAVAS